MHFLYAAYKDERIITLEGDGYEIVEPTEEMKKKHPRLYKDNMIRIKDTVLVMCPEEQWVQRNIDKENMCQQLSQSNKAILENNIDQLGAKANVTHVSTNNI